MCRGADESALAVLEDGGELGGRQRRAVQETLRLVASQLPQQLQLSGFSTPSATVVISSARASAMMVRTRLPPERLSSDCGDEAAVDLQCIDGQGRQPAQ